MQLQPSDGHPFNTSMIRSLASVLFAALALVACSGAETAPASLATASVLGSAPVDPPAAPLAGLHLEGQIAQGETVLFWDVEFSAEDTTGAHIADTVTTATAGSVVGSVEGGRLRLTTESDLGEVHLYAFGSGAGALLGFE